MKIPSLILKQLYTFGSLENTEGGVSFSLKNRLSDSKVIRLRDAKVGDVSLPPEKLTLHVDGEAIPGNEISPEKPVEFPLRQIVRIEADCPALDDGKHDLKLRFETDNFGKLSLKVTDAIAKEEKKRVSIPYDKDNDFAAGPVRARQDFVKEYTGAPLDHVFQYSFDSEDLKGNIENFTGAAQVPIGFAGPINMLGEYAQGEFLVPLATTEGTLVASYNRGIKVLNLSGGVTTTVVDDCMQRAPVFVFDSAREARSFRQWVYDNMDTIRQQAETTSSVAKLIFIDIFMAGKFAYLRFNFETGDAAGQNMVGRATFAACSWVLDHYEGIRHFYLESNLATDKKASQINIMRTRGKRVIAEVTVPREVLIQNMRVEPESLQYHAQIANVGAFLSGANNNGCHSPNSITAMFIATGQDVANVAESSAGIVYTEITPERDLYISITIPSLIVATYGGGTGLATQRECLEAMDCYGKGKVRKFAEIVAGVALAGEISLASAISSLDWVSSHEKYGRNR